MKGKEEQIKEKQKKEYLPAEMRVIRTGNYVCPKTYCKSYCVGHYCYIAYCAENYSEKYS